MSGSNGYLAEGTLYLNREVNGVATGWKKVTGTTTFAIKTSSEIKEQQSKDRGKFGQITASVAIPKPTELKVTISEFQKESLAMALMGDDVIVTEAGGTVTAEAITAKLDVFVELTKNRLVAGSVIVTNTGASTTYVENTDYEVNYALGMIMAKTGGAITAEQAIKVTFQHSAKSGYKINGATQTQIKGALRLDGKNLVSDELISITVDRALLVSDSEVDFLSDDFNQMSMSGRMETLSGKTTPFVVERV